MEHLESKCVGPAKIQHVAAARVYGEGVLIFLFTQKMFWK